MALWPSAIREEPDPRCHGRSWIITEVRMKATAIKHVSSPTDLLL